MANPWLDFAQDDEPQFRSWYDSWAERLDLAPDPDDPLHHYDYRAAFRAGAEPGPDGHWPSEFKAPDHPNRYVDGVDTISGAPAAGENPWAEFAEAAASPEERLRRMQERFPDAMPALGEDEEGGFQRPLQHEILAQLGTRIKRGVVGLGELPEAAMRISSASQGLMNRALLPESLERRVEQNREEALDLGDRALDAVAPDPLQRWAGDVREEYAGAKDRLAEAGAEAGLPPWLTAAADTGLEAGAIAADPTNFIPAGAAVKGASRLARGAAPEVAQAAGRAAGAVDDGLMELSRASRAIGGELADELSITPKPEAWSGQVLSSVDDVTRQSVGVQPGISVSRETLPNIGEDLAIAYRAPDGRVIAGGHAVIDERGAVQVADLAVDRSSGLLGGRAVVSVGEELAKLGPVNFLNDLSPESFRLVKKAVERGKLRLTDEAAGQLARAETAHARAAEALLGPEVHIPTNKAGEAGFVRVRVNSAPGSAGFFQKWFSNWGDYAAMGREVGEAAAEAKRLTGSAIKTEGKRAEMIVRDAALEVKRYHQTLAGAGMERDLDETLEYVLAGLEGEHAFDGAEALGERMAAAREHLDSLSRTFEAELADSLERDLIRGPGWQARAKELREIIRGNMGKWNRRSFEAFRNADWENLVKAPDSPERWRWDGFVEWAKKEIVSRRMPDSRAADPSLLRSSAPAIRPTARAAPRDVDPARFAAPAPPEPTHPLLDASRADRSLLAGDDMPPLGAPEEMAASGVGTRRSPTGRSPLLRPEDASPDLARYLQPARPRPQVSGEPRSLMGSGRSPTADSPLLRPQADLDDSMVRPDLTFDEKVAEIGIADEELTALAEGLGNKYLRRDPEVFLGFGDRTLVPTEKLGSAKARLDLPKQIDDLLGLDKDPLVRYRESVLALAHDIETLRFKKNLLDAGDGKIFFDQPTGNFSAQVRGASGLDPLAGRYTSPEIHAVIAAATDGARGAATLLAKTSSLVKAGKTVYSPFVTHPRNLFSWVPMITANGHTIKAWNPQRWARSGLTVASGKIAKGGAAERALNAVARHVTLADGRKLSDVVDYSALDLLRERLLRLQKAGVVGESTTAGDVSHYLGVAGEMKTLNQLAKTRVGKGFGKFGRAMEWLYGAEDDLGKLVAFDATERDLRWAMDGASEEEIFAEAARRIRDTTPTYSKIAPATRALRDNPILSAFPTFTQEVFRNAKNGLVTALTDLRSPNPKMRVLGAKRLGGLITAASAPAVIAAAGRKATGIDEEGMNALREFVAPWDRNAHLVPTSVDGYKIGAVNLSYMMPHAIFSEPYIAAAVQVAQGEGPVEDVVEGALSAAWELSEPFLSREILIDGILDYMVENRGKVWDPNKSPDVNARAIAHAVYRSASPGAIQWMERALRAGNVGEALEQKAGEDELAQFVASLLQKKNQYGREYKLGEEMTAGFTGIRPLSYDLYDGLGYKTAAFKRSLSAASTLNNRAKNHPSKLPPAVVLERRREANAQFREGWEALHRAVEAMRTIGAQAGKDPAMVDRDIRKKLNEERIGRKWRESIMDNAYEDAF